MNAQERWNVELPTKQTPLQLAPFNNTIDKCVNYMRMGKCGILCMDSKVTGRHNRHDATTRTTGIRDARISQVKQPGCRNASET
eukprot:756799-Hanusia_phi.AAC.3